MEEETGLAPRRDADNSRPVDQLISRPMERGMVQNNVLAEAGDAFHSLAAYASSPIEWIWKDYIARGKLSLILGDSGIGKSLVALQVAAMVTQGRNVPQRFLLQEERLYQTGDFDRKIFDEPWQPPEAAAEKVDGREWRVDGSEDAEIQEIETGVRPSPGLPALQRGRPRFQQEGTEESRDSHPPLAGEMQGADKTTNAKTPVVLPACVVLMVSAEDGIEDTIRPRLEAAHADVARVFIQCVDKAGGLRPRATGQETNGAVARLKKEGRVFEALCDRGIDEKIFDAESQRGGDAERRNAETVERRELDVERHEQVPVDRDVFVAPQTEVVAARAGLPALQVSVDGDVFVAPQTEVIAARAGLPALQVSSRPGLGTKENQQDPGKDGGLIDELAAVEARLVALRERGVEVKLVVIDPIDHFLRGVHQRTKDRLARCLVELAARWNAAVVVVGNFAPSRSGPSTYESGKIGWEAFVNAARSVFVVAQGLDHKRQRLMLPAKLNLSQKSPSLEFMIGKEGIEWRLKQSSPTVAEYFQQAAGMLRNPLHLEETGGLYRAVEWLRETLDFKPMPSHDIQISAYNNGISYSTLRRAFAHLGCKAFKKTGTRRWFWRLPDQAHPLIIGTVDCPEIAEQVLAELTEENGGVPPRTVDPMHPTTIDEWRAAAGRRVS